MMKDFFISYSSNDKQWAEWIAWTLEEAGYTTIIQAWDFQAGENFILAMQDAAAKTKQTVAVLSENYLNALYTQPEWAAAFVQDPTGDQRKLIPVRIDDCQPSGMLSAIIYIDLDGLDGEAAKERLLEGIKRERGKPDTAPDFPGDPSTESFTYKPTARSHSTTTQDAPLPKSPPSNPRSYVGGDDITTGNLENSTGVAIGREITQNITIFNNMPANSVPFPGQAGASPETSHDGLIEEKIRLDVASPTHATVEEQFDLAVAVRQPDSPLLSIEDLQIVQSGDGEIFRQTDEQTVLYRIEIESQQCAVEPKSQRIRLRPKTNSRPCFFQITPKKSGEVRLLINAFQEEKQDSVVAAQTRIQIDVDVPVRGTSSGALEIWRDKLNYLLEQEAIITDPAQRFALKKQIEEAEAKIRALS